MGYTHYWEFKPIPRGKAKQVEALYQRALKDCNKVIQAWQSRYPKGGYSDHYRLSGYSAHSKEYGGLEVNGKGDLAHEPFTLREHYRQNLESPGWDFCKTARKPYDTVVVACLAILKHYLKGLIVVSSDGCCEDWADGLLFTRTCLQKSSIRNPMINKRGGE